MMCFQHAGQLLQLSTVYCHGAFVLPAAVVRVDGLGLAHPRWLAGWLAVLLAALWLPRVLLSGCPVLWLVCESWRCVAVQSSSISWLAASQSDDGGLDL